MIEESAMCELNEQRHHVGTVWHPFLAPYGFDKCVFCSCEVSECSTSFTLRCGTLSHQLPGICGTWTSWCLSGAWCLLLGDSRRKLHEIYVFLFYLAIHLLLPQLLVSPCVSPSCNTGECFLMCLSEYALSLAFHMHLMSPWYLYSLTCSMEASCSTEEVPVLCNHQGAFLSLLCLALKLLLWLCNKDLYPDVFASVPPPSTLCGSWAVSLLLLHRCFSNVCTRVFFLSILCESWHI